MKYQYFTLLLLFGETFAVRTIIPRSCFDSESAFDIDFNYLYPWGSDHNGAARMDKSKVSIANKIITLTASPASGEKPASSGGKSVPVKYRSGTVHVREKFNVSRTGGYDTVADFKATTIKGTWPAFWLTAVDGWPPEIDLAEWKGSGKVSFNTFNTCSQVATKDVSYPNPGDWQSHHITSHLIQTTILRRDVPRPLSQLNSGEGSKPEQPHNNSNYEPKHSIPQTRRLHEHSTAKAMNHSSGMKRSHHPAKRPSKLSSWIIARGRLCRRVN